MTAMGKLIWILGLWLVGIAPAMALDMNTPEMLRYKVYWGFVRVGTAQLDYVPSPNSYVLRALVKDTSSLIDMDDSWESRGSHTAAKPFTPSVYSIKQAENSYRADKTMTFDAKSKTVVYANKIDPTDKAEPLPLGEARDVLATVYAWRMSGLAAVQNPDETNMVSLKRFLTLKRGAGVKTSLTVGDKTYDVWRVQLTTVKDTGKAGKDVWTVYVTDDANLLPLQIIASTKFGTFKAILAP
jgi:hypothetical protein